MRHAYAVVVVGGPCDPARLRGEPVKRLDRSVRAVEVFPSHGHVSLQMAGVLIAANGEGS